MAFINGNKVLFGLKKTGSSVSSDDIEAQVSAILADKLQNYVQLENGKIPSSVLPTTSDDEVIEYPTKEDFPDIGESGKLYISTSNNTSFRWDGDEYVPMTSAALPEVSESDNDKFLQVKDGKWSVVSIPMAEGAKF